MMKTINDTRSMQKLTKEAKQYTLSLGAGKVGIANVDYWENAPEGCRPSDTIKSAKAVLVFLYPHLESIFMAKHPRAWQRTLINCRYFIDQMMAIPVARFLEDHGFVAVPIPAAIPVDMSPPRNGLFGDISHRHAAVGAGLGEIGHNQLLVTPEWGPRVWITSIVTNAPLITDNPFKPYICDTANCGEPCIRACPAKALTGDPEIGTNKKACGQYSMQATTAGLVKHLRDILDEKDTEKRRRLILGPTTWYLHQWTAAGTVGECGNCLLACPVGKKLSQTIK
jgi:epoxyqueuosine reductase